jgi:hypothetical protein
MMHDGGSPVGKFGRVTAQVGPGKKMGEVRIAIRGGTEDYLAVTTGDGVLELNAMVIVTQLRSPRVVVVELAWGM